MDPEALCHPEKYGIRPGEQFALQWALSQGSSMTGCRYEAEENSTVCQSMERTAELFISGAADPEFVEEEEASEQPGDDAHKQEASGHAAGAA